MVELLVVIAVVAILASLLLPAVTRTQERAAGVGCLNHLRQLQIAFHLYSDDQNGLPSPSETDVSVPGYPRWVNGLMSTTFSQDFTEMTNRQMLIAPGPGHIGPYLKTPEVFHCPGDRSRTNLLRPRGPLRVRSYTMNSYIVMGEGIRFDHNGNFLYSRSAFVRWADFNRTSPDRVWIFIDEHELTIDNSSFQTQWALGPGWKWAGQWPARRHGGRGALSFADGHAEMPKWRDSSTGPAVRTWAAALEVGFNPGNADYAWIWERTNGGL